MTHNSNGAVIPPQGPFACRHLNPEQYQAYCEAFEPSYYERDEAHLRSALAQLSRLDKPSDAMKELIKHYQQRLAWYDNQKQA